MRVVLHRQFKKGYKKLKTADKEKFAIRRDLFLKEDTHPLLNNHRLHGHYAGFHSINITGDIRVLFEYIDKNTAHFIIIDTHSNLYS
jgi:mRNA-degrading endonuclease YafQ of YafQ-DinJ toxin-antitoxin module